MCRCILSYVFSVGQVIGCLWADLEAPWAEVLSVLAVTWVGNHASLMACLFMPSISSQFTENFEIVILNVSITKLYEEKKTILVINYGQFQHLLHFHFVYIVLFCKSYVLTSLHNAACSCRRSATEECPSPRLLFEVSCNSFIGVYSSSQCSTNKLAIVWLIDAFERSPSLAHYCMTHNLMLDNISEPGMYRVFTYISTLPAWVPLSPFMISMVRSFAWTGLRAHQISIWNDG